MKRVGVCVVVAAAVLCASLALTASQAAAFSLPKPRPADPSVLKDIGGLSGVSQAPYDWASVREFFGVEGDRRHEQGDLSVRPRDFFVSALTKLVDYIESVVPRSWLEARKNRRANDKNSSSGGKLPGPYFGFMPEYVTSAMVGGDAVSWEAPCFKSTKLSVAATQTGAVLTFELAEPQSFLCSDFYSIGTVEGGHLETFWTAGTHKVVWTWHKDIKPSELDDIKRNGFRVFRFLGGWLPTLYDVYETAMLFLPAMTSKDGSVPEKTAEANAAFLDEYVFLNMTKRSTQVVSIDESQINTGDFFGIIRLDGLDPMLAWAMGGTHTGHTTVAIRNDGILYVCESTVKGNYWPTNGIQCTPYATWIKQAQQASFHVAHLPLNAESRAKINETAMWQFFKQHEGLDYGFGNILWGWIDQPEGNYPFPLSSHLHMLLPAMAGRISPAISDLLWNRAFNVRLGTKNLDTADAYAEAASRGLNFTDLVTMVELDSYMYNQTNNDGKAVVGRSMVCNVFVCAMWKASGLFGDLADDVQCGETTNWDVYTLDIFEGDASSRPQQCIAADPDLPYCQLLGEYKLRLPYFNTRQLYKNSFNNCPRGQPPKFNKPVAC
eukprot:TRINITY_DN3171_c0_g1_i1.p1 TRINITY_DN3171_c0_g1~~TRINITY_DN3171_c0_g1_i1.p1  ORF type:complete len:607 (+),score=325.94 TRINITY_DN3171_c0_g1_i1:78-1898(+)